MSKSKTNRKLANQDSVLALAVLGVCFAVAVLVVVFGGSPKKDTAIDSSDAGVVETETAD